MNGLFSVAGKSALVTGGGTGIGRMIAEALAMGGANVMICSRKLDAVTAAADEINNAGYPGAVTAFAGDVGSQQGIEAIVAEVAERADGLNILVNNAGITWGNELGEFPYGDRRDPANLRRHPSGDRSEHLPIGIGLGK